MGWAGWGNWAGSGGCAGKARYVLLPLIFVLFYFNSVFYFAGLFLICFNIKSFYKILEIDMGVF